MALILVIFIIILLFFSSKEYYSDKYNAYEINLNNDDIKNISFNFLKELSSKLTNFIINGGTDMKNINFYELHVNKNLLLRKNIVSKLIEKFGEHRVRNCTIIHPNINLNKQAELSHYGRQYQFDNRINYNFNIYLTYLILFNPLTFAEEYLQCFNEINYTNEKNLYEDIFKCNDNANVYKNVIFYICSEINKYVIF